MTHKENFELFLKELIDKHGKDIYTLLVFGSDHFYIDPTSSDIDLFIIEKDTSKRQTILTFLREIELKYFGTTHSKTSDYLWSNYLIGGDYYGIEPLLIGKDEFDEDFNSKSTRLKIFSTFFISKDLFLRNIKETGKVVYGENYLENFKPKNLGFFDRIKVFTFAGLILFTIPFFHLFQRKEFIVWSIKGLKYHFDIAGSYNQLMGKPSILNSEGIKKIYEFRYKPEQYKGNRFWLYIKVWLYIWSNIWFLFGINRYFK